MIHQIALFQLIPKFREALNAFELETCGNLSVCEEDKTKLSNEHKTHTTEYHRARNNALKYMDRLKRSTKTRNTLSDLERSLHE